MMPGGGRIWATPGRRKALSEMAETKPPLVDVTEPKDLLGLILRRWWMIALGVTLGAVLAVLALRVVPPTYSATATQLIKGVPGSGTGAPYLAAQFAVARAKSYPALIFSSTVLDYIRTDMGNEFTDARLRDQLSASNPPDTPLVNITATGTTAQEAQNLANSASRHLARFITQIETVSGTAPVVVETAVQAGLPAAPTSPQPTLYLALGLTGGFAAGVIGILAWGGLASHAQTRRARRILDDSATDGPGQRPDTEPEPGLDGTAQTGIALQTRPESAGSAHTS